MPRETMKDFTSPEAAEPVIQGLPRGVESRTISRRQFLKLAVFAIGAAGCAELPQALTATPLPRKTDIAPTPEHLSGASFVTKTEIDRTFPGQGFDKLFGDLIADLKTKPGNALFDSYSPWGLIPNNDPKEGIYPFITAVNSKTGAGVTFQVVPEADGLAHARTLRPTERTSPDNKVRTVFVREDGTVILSVNMSMADIVKNPDKIQVIFSPFGEENKDKVPVSGAKLVSYILATATPEAPEPTPTAETPVSPEMTPEQIQKNIEDFLAGRTKINENIYDKKNRDLFRYTNVDLRILPLGYFELENSADLLQATDGLWEGGGDAQVVLLGFGIQDNMRILYLGFKNQTTGERIVIPFTTGFIKLPEGFMKVSDDGPWESDKVGLEVSKTNPPLYRPLTVQLNTLYPYNSDLGKEILPAVGKPVEARFASLPGLSSREEFIAKCQAEYQGMIVGEAGWAFDHTQTEQSLILWLQGKGLKPAYAIVKSNLGQPIPDTSKLPWIWSFRIPAPPAK